MPRRPPQARRSRQRPRRRTGALPAAVLAAASALITAGAADAQSRLFQARAILSWQRYDAGEQTSEGFRQTYDLGLRRVLSERFQVRFWFRGDGADNDFTLDSEASSSSFRQQKVGGELTLTYPKLQLRLAYDDIGTDLGGTRSGDRDLTRGTALLTWRPDRFPDLTVEAEERGFSDRLRGEDRTDRRFQGTLDQTLGPLWLAATLRTTDLDDARGALRTADEVQGQAALNLSFWEGKLASTTQLYVLDSRIDERGVGPGPVAVPERVAVAAARSGVDPSPEDARDQPLAPAGELIDGIFTATGIDLGPAGDTFRNVALDFQRVADVDEVRLHVRDAAGEVVATGGSLDWRVYTSADGVDWVRLAAGVVTRFDAARSLYEVTFPQQSTRHLKVVSFGLNLVETVLVEVEAYDNRPIAPGERRRTDARLASAETALTARPRDGLTLSWSGRWNLSSRTPRGSETEEESRTTDRDQYASVVFEPAPWTDLELRWELRSVDQSAGRSTSFGQNFEQWVADAIFYPRTGIDLRVEALRSTDDGDGGRVTTDGLALKGHARLWRAVDLRLDVGEQRSDLGPTDARTLRRRFANGWAIAQLTTTLQLTLNLTSSRSDLEGGGTLPEDLPAPDEDRWTAEVYWRPGPPLGLGARVGRAASGDFSATVRSFRVEWTPFAGGALHLATFYDEEVDTTTRRTFRRLSVAPGWTINRHASLNLNATLFDFGGGDSPRTQSLLANLSLRK